MPDTDQDFTDAALSAGFTQEQADFMLEWIALQGHHHEIEEVDGLEETLEEVLEPEED